MSTLQAAQQAWDNAQPPETSLARLKMLWQADSYEEAGDACINEQDDLMLQKRADELRQQAEENTQ